MSGWVGEMKCMRERRGAWTTSVQWEIGIVLSTANSDSNRSHVHRLRSSQRTHEPCSPKQLPHEAAAHHHGLRHATPDARHHTSNSTRHHAATHLLLSSDDGCLGICELRLHRRERRLKASDLHTYTHNQQRDRSRMDVSASHASHNTIAALLREHSGG